MCESTAARPANTDCCFSIIPPPIAPSDACCSAPAACRRLTQKDKPPLQATEDSSTCVSCDAGSCDPPSRSTANLPSLPTSPLYCPPSPIADVCATEGCCPSEDSEEETDACDCCSSGPSRDDMLPKSDKQTQAEATNGGGGCCDSPPEEEANACGASCCGPSSSSEDEQQKEETTPPICCSGPKKPVLNETACGEGCCAEADEQEEEQDGCTDSCCEEAERAEDGEELLGREQMNEADVGNDDSQCACTSFSST